MSGLMNLLVDRPDWHQDAACQQTDPELFFPEKGQDPRPAQRVCRRCPVRLECLRYAFDNREAHGVWGGTTARERRHMRSYQRRPEAA